MTKNALKKLISASVEVVKKQLADLLVSGVYGSEPTDEQRSKMSHCVLHILMSEYAFCTFDYSQNRRRHSSIHYHSTIHMPKHNKTISKWLVNKTSDTQHLIIAKAGVDLRQSHKTSEKAALAKRKLLLKANREKKERGQKEDRCCNNEKAWRSMHNSET